MIVFGKQINVKSIARVLIVVLASSWFIPISCTSLLFGLHEEPFMMAGGGGLVSDNFDSNHPDSQHFTIVAESKDSREAFVAVPYSNMQSRNSLTFLMSKSEGSKIEKPIQLEKDGDRYVYSSVSYKVIEQGVQEQLIEVVRNVDMPDSSGKYKNRYKVVNNNITPVSSFKQYSDSFGATEEIMASFLIAIVIYLFSKLLLYLLFTKNENTKSENIETNNASKYYWKGIIAGENQEGEILAQNKEDTTNQLRDKKVIITQLKLANSQAQDNTKSTNSGKKPKNAKNNKIKLFVDKAKSGKIAIWILSIIFLYISFTESLVVPYSDWSLSIIVDQFFGTIICYGLYRLIIFTIFHPYLAIIERKNIVVTILVWPISVAFFFIAIDMGMSAYTEKVNMELSRSNHNSIKDFIETSFTKCSSNDTDFISLADKSNNSTINIPCSEDMSILARKFARHFIIAGFKNPNNSRYCCVVKAGEPLHSGVPNTYIYAISDTQISIKTSIGTPMHMLVLTDIVAKGN